MEGARLTIFPKRCLCGVWKTGRRGGEVDLKLAVCLGLLKPSTHCAKGTLAWISWKPRCGAPGNQSLTELHWPVLHPVWTQAYLSTHLSLHFTHLVNRFLKTNKIKFPIKDQKKKNHLVHRSQCLPEGTVRSSRILETKLQGMEVVAVAYIIFSRLLCLVF